MPRIEVIAADMPFGERLRTGFGYPLRGAALPTCVVLALMHYVGLLPAYIGMLASMLVWAASWRYGAECLLHTARGYADPPDVGIDESGAAGWALTAVHMLVVALYVNSAMFFPQWLWPLMILCALMLPAIDMSLAFDGNLLLALNPLGGWRIARSFGLAYLAPVAINLLLVALILLASIGTAYLPRVLALPLFAFACSYLIVLAFHLMGSLIHQRHERFGIELEAEKLASATGQDGDLRLVDEARQLASDDPMAALRQLAVRLQERTAPTPVHQLYRELLHQQGLRDDLLVHGQIWIAALIANGEQRRALGLVQECSVIDAGFIPDDPRNAADLALLAERSGMSRMALKLCRGHLSRWPRDPQAPQIGLLAASLIAGEGHATEAAVLLGKLAAAWPDHPRHAELVAQVAQLHVSAKTA